MNDRDANDSRPPYSRLALIITLAAIIGLVLVDYLASTH